MEPSPPDTFDNKGVCVWRILARLKVACCQRCMFKQLSRVGKRVPTVRRCSPPDQHVGSQAQAHLPLFMKTRLQVADACCSVACLPGRFRRGGAGCFSHACCRIRASHVPGRQSAYPELMCEGLTSICSCQGTIAGGICNVAPAPGREAVQASTSLPHTP